MIKLVFLHNFARSAKIKCGGFDWTKFHTFKHVHLSLISVVYLLYLIIIGTFLCACLCINIWRITAILLAFYETKGILVILTMWCVPYVGGSQVGPAHPWWSLDGDKLARRKAGWQALKVISGCKFTSGSKCAGAGGQRVASGSGFSSSRFSSGSECAHACGMKSCIWKPNSISQRVQESDCTNVQKCQLLFRSLLCRVNLRQSQLCSLKVLGEHLSKWGKIGAKVKFKSGCLIKGKKGSTITWRKRRNL